MGNQHPANHQPLERGGGLNVGKFGDLSTRRSLRSSRRMERIRKSFRDSFRRRRDRVPESSRPHQWHADEAAVRSGTCTFAVKYLGCVEVFESRGMQVCEEALKVLRCSRRRSVRAMLHVSGDGLRVVEDETKGLIVDQTIERVSFCAPDRTVERGFSYICRDGTTRRWMCHGFLAARESGERLSHAVGCAFAVCLERKQKRDQECGVTMTFDATNSTFTRTGSFRQQSLTERQDSGAGAIELISPTSRHPFNHNNNCVGVQNQNGFGNGGLSKSTVAPPNPFAIERPHATPSLLQRQGSCRGFSTLGQNSPFKRQMSLRVNDLPSTTARLNAYRWLQQQKAQPNGSVIGDLHSPILEMGSPTSAAHPASLMDITPNGGVMSGAAITAAIPTSHNDSISSATDSVTALCQQLSQGLSKLTHSGSNDDFTASVSSTNSNSSSAFPTNQNTLNLNLTAINNTIVNTNNNNNNNNNTTSVTCSTLPTRSEIAEVSGGSRAPNGSVLPRPDQWLGQMVHQHNPYQQADGGRRPMEGSVRRAPHLGMTANSRAMSLDTGSYMAANSIASVSDPFDAEWAARRIVAAAGGVATTPTSLSDTTSTVSGAITTITAPITTGSTNNPFLTSPKPFQVQL